MLYELTTGRVPFDEASEFDLRCGFTRDAPRKPLRLREGMKGRRFFDDLPAAWC